MFNPERSGDFLLAFLLFQRTVEADVLDSGQALPVLIDEECLRGRQTKMSVLP